MPRYRFGLFEFDSDRLRLQKLGVRVQLQRKPHTVLATLLEEPGRTVTRQELYQRLWADSNVVDFDQGLNVAVKKLRDALGDSRDQPIYIETVAGSGYRFIQAVELVRDGTSDDGRVVAVSSTQPWPTGSLNGIKSPNGGEAARSTKPAVVIDTHPKGSPKTAEKAQTRFRVWMIVGALGLASAGAFGAFYITRPLPPPRITDYVQLTRDARMKFVNGADANYLYLAYETATGQGTAAEVPVVGGQITPVAVDLGKGPTYNVILGEVSPDGTRIFAYVPTHDSDERDLWVTGTSGHPSHHLARGIWASWSPDGKLVVFSTADCKLFTIPSDGGTAHLLADLSSLAGKGGGVYGLAWSPEGRRIRFNLTPDFQNFGIWEISPDGSNLHRVLPAWDKFNKACCGHWTPDGDFFLFQLLGKAGPAAAPNQLWAIDERHRGLRPPIKEPIQLTNNMVWWGFPIPSRDSKKIFTKATTYSGELDRLDKQTEQLRPYLGGISVDYVAFSKDGKYVAYVSYPDGTLWRCNRDGTGLIQLTSPPMRPLDLAWSPDSQQITFDSRMPNGYSTPGGRAAIYVVSSHGGTPTLLIPEDNAWESNASWSPDGKKIVYSTGDVRNLVISGLSTVTHTLDLASHKISTLPSGPKTYYSPTLSPDGRYVSFLAAPLPSDPVIFDLQTQRRWTLHGLTSFGLPDWNTWSHDSKSIYFLLSLGPNGESGVYRVPVNGGKPERVVDLTGFRQTGWTHHSWMGLDPTDAPLLLRDTGNTELFALTLARK